MQMGVDGLDQLEIEFAQQLAVAVDLLQHGIEDQRLAAGAARQEIAVGTRNTVEELAEDHGRTRRELPGDSTTFRAYKRSNSLCKQEDLEDLYSCDGRVGVTWPPLSFPAKAGNPVRRALSVPLAVSEYWIARLRGR